MQHLQTILRRSAGATDFARAASARLRALFVATSLVAGCNALQSDAPRGLHPEVRVEHFLRNRCGSIAERPCQVDADCPVGACVSVLPSDAGAFGRDGGHTVRIGDRILWQFGDSFAVAGMKSATAAWGSVHDPLSLRDAVDEKGEPSQFLRFTASEAAFNDARSEPPSCCFAREACPASEPYCQCPAETDCAVRIALWPGDGVETSPGQATLYYDRQIVGVAPYDFTAAGIGVATVRDGAPSATRLVDAAGEPVLLFAADEPHFARGLAVGEADGTYFYLYANTRRAGCAVDVLLARVPTTRMAERGHYRFWDGSGWSAHLADARPIAASILGGLGSIGWNDHLRAYLSTWSDICTGGDTLLLRTAPAPQGPWGPAIAVDLAPLGAGADAYYGMVHPEFGRGRDLLVTYFQPLEEVYGQMRVVRLRLP